MVSPVSRVHSKLIDDDVDRKGYLLNQKAHNYVRQLQLNHAITQVLQGKKGKPLTNQLLLPGKHPDLTWPVYIGEKGEAIAICTQGILGKGAFGGVYVGVNLDTGEGRAVKLQFPGSEELLNDVREEESVLDILGRFDDRIVVKNSPLAQDFVQVANLKALEGLYKTLDQLQLISEKEFLELLESNSSQLSATIVEKINKKYPGNFQQFKSDFLAAGGSGYLKSIEMDLPHFEKNITPDLFQEILAEQLSIYQESLDEQMSEISEFMEIGSQHLAWGVNLVEYTENEEHSDVEKLEVAIQVLEKLEELHQPQGEKAPHGLVHRDVKAANMIWDEETKTLTVVDMGFTKAKNSEQHFSETRLRGTPTGLAPELILQMFNEEPIIYSAKTDMYAAGIVMLELFSTQQVEIPFTQQEGFERGASEQAMEVKASFEQNPNHSGLPPVLEQNVSDILKDDVEEPQRSINQAIRKMLDVNPEVRATFGETLSVLKQIRAGLTGELEAQNIQEQRARPAQASAAVSDKLSEQAEIKKILTDGVKSIKSALTAMEITPEDLRRGRTSLLYQAPSPKQKQIAEYHYWLRQIQALSVKNNIKARDVQALIQDIKVELKSEQPQLAVHQHLLGLKTVLKAHLGKENMDKENIIKRRKPDN